MAADRSTRAAEDEHLPPPVEYRRRVPTIERHQLEYALDRLQSHSELTPAQRETVEQLARGITTSLAPAAIETLSARNRPDD